MTTIFKVDCSNHDWSRGSMDVAAMRRDGIDVFIHKATDGPNFYRDPYFAPAMSRARTAGIPVTGAYHVLWNGNVAAQVDWFIDTVLAAAPWAATEPYEWMWDCEPFSYNGGAPSPATINAACDRFMQRLPHHRPLAYCPKWAYESLTGIRCPVVASSYGTNPAVPYRQAYPGDNASGWAAYGGVGTPAVLQFGSRTIVGAQHDVDADAFRGTLDQFRALIGGAQTPTSSWEASVFQVIDNGPFPQSWVITDLSTFCNRRFSSDYLESLREQGMPRYIISVGQMRDVLALPERPVDTVSAAVADLAAKVDADVQSTTVTVTQDQIDAGVLKALQDPDVLKGIGDAIASHLHVN